MTPFQLSELPVYAALASLGQKVLVLGFFAWLLVETYKLATKGQCDYLMPCVRFAVGSLLLRSLPAIHQEVSTTLLSAGQQLGTSNLQHLFLKAYMHAYGGLQGSTLAMLGNVFSLQGMFALGSVGLAMAMQVVKVLVLDILWPICLGLVVAYGALAVPLGVLPGLSTLKGWVKNVIEVSLWPLVFQAIVGLMLGSFERTLASVSRLDFNNMMTDPLRFSEDLRTLVSWWAICLAYLLICLLTPLVSSMVVRSTPIGIVAGIVAAQTARILGAGVGRLAGSGLGRVMGTAAGVAGGAAMNGAAFVAQAVAAQGAPLSQAGGSPSLDQRTHRSAPSGAPKGES